MKVALGEPKTQRRCRLRHSDNAKTVALLQREEQRPTARERLNAEIHRRIELQCIPACTYAVCHRDGLFRAFKFLRLMPGIGTSKALELDRMSRLHSARGSFVPIVKL